MLCVGEERYAGGSEWRSLLRTFCSALLPDLRSMVCAEAVLPEPQMQAALIPLSPQRSSRSKLVQCKGDVEASGLQRSLLVSKGSFSLWPAHIKGDDKLSFMVKRLWLKLCLQKKTLLFSITVIK